MGRVFLRPWENMSICVDRVAVLVYNILIILMEG